MSQAATENASVVIVGATGHVGVEVLKLLQESPVLRANPVLLASSESQEDTLDFAGDKLDVKAAKDYQYQAKDIVILALPYDGAEIEFNRAKQAGAFIIDATGVGRQVPNAPLAAPHLDEGLLKAAIKSRVVVLPEPMSMSLAAVLAPLDGSAKLQSAVVSTYQTVSRYGHGGIEELAKQSVGLLGGAGAGGFSGQIFPHQVAFNVLPQVGRFEGVDTTTEKHLAADTAALLGRDIPIAATCAIVPTFVGEALSVHATFEKPIDAPKARDIVSNIEGVDVIDNPNQEAYSTPYGSAEVNHTFVSRIREGATPNTLQFWVVADHLRVHVAGALVRMAEKVALEIQKLA